MIWLSFFDNTGKGEVYPLSQEDALRVAREIEYKVDVDLDCDRWYNEGGR